MNFELNQIFTDTYPPEAAQFCNRHGYVIKEIEKQGTVRRFQIRELPAKPAEQVLAEQQAAYISAVQQRLDTFAQTRGYDGIMSAASYFGSSNPRFKQEADRAIALRDVTWARCYEILAEVQTGKREVPPLDTLLAELPALTWE